MLRHEESTQTMQDAMGLLASHFHSISNQAVRVSRMTGFWKIDRKGHPNLLYCTNFHTLKATSDGEEIPIKMNTSLKQGDLGIRFANRTNTLEILKDGYKLRQLTYELAANTVSPEALSKSIGIDAYRHFARRPLKSTENMRMKKEGYCCDCRALLPKTELFPTKLKYLIAKLNSLGNKKITTQMLIREVRPLSMFVEEPAKIQPTTHIPPLIRELFPKMKAEEFLQEMTNPQFNEKEVFVCSSCFESLAPYMGKIAGLRSKSNKQSLKPLKDMLEKNFYRRKSTPRRRTEVSDDSSLYILGSKEQTRIRDIPIEVKVVPDESFMAPDESNDRFKTTKRSFFQRIAKSSKEIKEEYSEPSGGKHKLSAIFPKDGSEMNFMKSRQGSGVPGEFWHPKSRTSTQDVEYSVSESVQNKGESSYLVPQSRVQTAVTRKVVFSKQSGLGVLIAKEARQRNAVLQDSVQTRRRIMGLDELSALGRPGMGPGRMADESEGRSRESTAAFPGRAAFAVGKARSLSTVRGARTIKGPEASQGLAARPKLLTAERRTQSAARSRAGYVPRGYPGVSHQRGALEELESGVRRPASHLG